jgi:hypothetical protein
MKKILLALSLLSSVTAFASDVCLLKDKRGYHPDGNPYVKVVLSCTDLEFQSKILLRYESYRVGNTTMFIREIKTEIIKDILADGYQKISSGTYVKNEH